VDNLDTKRDMTYELGTYDRLCISPKLAIERNGSGFPQMFSSHDWKVEYSKPYGNGLYVAFKCSNCEAIGHAIVEDVL
jgi:hypothetical protein